MKYLVIKDNKIINVIEWDGVKAWTPPPDCTVEKRTGDEWIGWEKNDILWIKPKQEAQ